MLKFKFFERNKELKVLCLGAHADDIEIGCGGSILRIMDEVPKAQFYWVVFSANGQRGEEAHASAKIFLEKAKSKEIVVKQFRESYFPFVGAQIKDYFETLKGEFSPDIIFTHYRNDAHQDHYLLSNLTWNTFRNNLVFEYEIPKFDGDLATPNIYVHLGKSYVKRKLDLVLENFTTQIDNHWFTEETFRSILRIRGVESNSPTNYAEGFHCRKIIF